MNIKAIVATTRNNVIAVSGQMPWACKEDMYHFRQTTTPHVVIMGRQTFEDMGSKPLKDRHNIVLTRQRGYVAEGCKVCHSVSDAISEAYRHDSDGTAFVIGGEQVYKQFAPHVDELILSVIDGEYVDAELLTLADTSGRGLKVNYFPKQEYEHCFTTVHFFPNTVFLGD